ncbi:hypothetical protein BKA57DRAFT_131851 [Linnemannia elongata]|nr:hypothetical protein BKA57DRAFT_131851 [Linnemannia elongata]
MIMVMIMNDCGYGHNTQLQEGLFTLSLCHSQFDLFLLNIHIYLIHGWHGGPTCVMVYSFSSSLTHTHFVAVVVPWFLVCTPLQGESPLIIVSFFLSFFFLLFFLLLFAVPGSFSQMSFCSFLFLSPLFLLLFTFCLYPSFLPFLLLSPLFFFLSLSPFSFFSLFSLSLPLLSPSLFSTPFIHHPRLTSVVPPISTGK